MFLQHFEVKNYMIHRDSKIDLDPITVFVGANNGGKSALFDALINFSMVSRGKISQAFAPGPFSYDAMKYHGSGKVARISYNAVLSESSNSTDTISYSISYGYSKSSGFMIHDETIFDETGSIIFDRSDSEMYPMGKTSTYLNNEQSIFAAIRQAQHRNDYVETNSLVTMVARDVSRISMYRLDPANLERPSRLLDTVNDEATRSIVPRLSYRGEGLAAVLYYLSETQNPAFGTIVEKCAQIVQGFETFEFNNVVPDKVGFSARFSDERGVVQAANLSDGTLISIGLVSLLTSSERNPIVCLEECENGLTPNVIRKIYDLMKEFVSGARGTPAQLLISSHSPYVVCEAWNGIERDFIYQLKSENGASKIRKFSDIIDLHQMPLEKDNDNKRTRLNLNTAERIMDGYLA
jgi:predicted ATPase